MLSPPWSTLTEKILPCQEGVRLPRQVAPGDVCVLIFQAGGYHGYHDEWWKNRREPVLTLGQCGQGIFDIEGPRYEKNPSAG